MAIYIHKHTLTHINTHTRICTPALPAGTDPDTNPYKQTCSDEQAGVATVFLFANELISSPSRLEAAALNSNCNDVIEMVGPAFTYMEQEAIAEQLTIITTQAIYEATITPDHPSTFPYSQRVITLLGTGVCDRRRVGESEESQWLCQLSAADY